MAPECLISSVRYSFESDVYMFGVCLFELFAEAEPWFGVSQAESAHRVLNRETLEDAGDWSGLPPRLIDVMRLCWAYEAKARPKMSAVHEALRALVAPAGGDGGDYTTPFWS